MVWATGATAGAGAAGCALGVDVVFSADVAFGAAGGTVGTGAAFVRTETSGSAISTAAASDGRYEAS